jgi:hypothetical protein
MFFFKISRLMREGQSPLALIDTGRETGAKVVAVARGIWDLEFGVS